MDGPLFYIAALVVIGLFFRMWLQHYRSAVKSLAAPPATGEEGSAATSVPDDLSQAALPVRLRLASAS